MKGIAISMLLIAWSSTAAYAVDVDHLPKITVSGSAEVKVVPDEVVFSLTVKKISKDIQTAKRMNDESVAQVIEQTRRFSVPPQNVQTINVTVEMKYEKTRAAKTLAYMDNTNQDAKRNFMGYEVSKTIIIRLTDISHSEEFFTEIMKTGVSEVNSVTFETSRLREHKDKSRELAVKAAREKAVMLCSALGQTIGKAIEISEMESSIYELMNSQSNMVTTAAGEERSGQLVTFAPGTIRIVSDIKVSFLLN